MLIWKGEQAHTLCLIFWYLFTYFVVKLLVVILLYHWVYENHTFQYIYMLCIPLNMPRFFWKGGGNFKILDVSTAFWDKVGGSVVVAPWSYSAVRLTCVSGAHASWVFGREQGTKMAA